MLFTKYSTSSSILRIEMSIVNLNITFVKKQKQTRPTPNAQLKDGARHSFITRNGRFHTKDGLFVWDGLSVW